MGGKNFNFFEKYFISHYSLDKNQTNDQKKFTNNTHNNTTGAIVYSENNRKD